MTDRQNKQIPIELVPGSKKKFGKHVDRIFVVRTLVSLDDDQIYTLHISRLLQANNYKYLTENHTVEFTTREIVNIKPYSQKLCAPYLSLALEKSNLASGRENVPIDTDIRLTFSNDVCASEIRDHNAACITLQTQQK